jgi:hypothetical protein
MQKYALKNFDMFFVVSWNEFLAHLAINLTVQKNYANATTSEPYLSGSRKNNNGIYLSFCKP